MFKAEKCQNMLKTKPYFYDVFDQSKANLWDQIWKSMNIVMVGILPDTIMEACGKVICLLSLQGLITYHAKGRFSRRQTDDFFLILPRILNMPLHANCLLRRQFAWSVISNFLGQIKKSISNCHLMKFLPSMQSINTIYHAELQIRSISRSDQDSCCLRELRISKTLIGLYEPQRTFMNRNVPLDMFA